VSAFALVSANDKEHMERFLRNLHHNGLKPKVVVTDGSTLYGSSQKFCNMALTQMA